MQLGFFVYICIMAIGDVINSFINNWSSKQELYLVLGTASDINESDFTFKFTPIAETSNVEDVRMKSIVDAGPETFVIVPKEGSKVVVGFHSKTVGQCLVVQQAAKIIINTAIFQENTESKEVNVENDYSINCDDVKVQTESWIFNQGGLGGLINIVDITEKLNDLVEDLNGLRADFNSHLHTGVSSGSASSGPPNKVVTTFDEFNKDDYEDTKIQH